MIDTAYFLLLILGHVFRLISCYDQIECGVPGRPLLGHFAPVKERYNAGERVRYACACDWLVGDVQRTCGSDAEWSGSVPVCVPAVSLPSSVRAKSIYWDNQYTYNFVQQSQMFLDGNETTCTKTFSCKALQIWITFSNATILKGVAFTFPTPKYPKMFVTTQNLQGKSQALCSESAAVKVETVGAKGSLPGTTVMYNCSSREIANGLLLDFEKGSECYFSLCEVTFYPEPNDSKCDFLDTPSRGSIEEKPDFPNQTLSYTCNSTLELSGFNMTSCRPNRKWTDQAPVFSEINTTDFQRNQINLHLNATDKRKGRRSRKYRTVIIYGSVTGAVVVLLLVGLAIFVCVIRRKRRCDAIRRTSLYRSSSQRSNSFDLSFRRNRHERRSSSNNYVVAFSKHGQQRHEDNEGPRSDIPDLLGNGVRMKGLTNSAIGHIYADPIYLEAENRPPPRQPTTYIKMAENDLYCPNT